MFSYGPDGCDEVAVGSPNDLKAFVGRRPVTWVDVSGLGDTGILVHIGQIFGLHGLAMEDVAQVDQRPKVETYLDHVFVVARMLSVVDDRVETEQLSLFVGAGFVLTFQERPGDCLEPVRERLRKGSGRIRTHGGDHLAYALLDAVVDGWFPVLEAMGERIEALEDSVLARPSPDDVAAIHRVKRDLMSIRRTVWPMRDALASLLRGEFATFTPETLVYLRDCHDHAVRVLDMVETYRELASGLLDVYMSRVSQKMNEVMKVLTIIATIFMPLSFLAGVYGMNFDPDASPFNMPELGWRYGYLAFWGVILVAAGSMVFAFRKRGWLGGGRPGRKTPPPP